MPQVRGYGTIGEGNVKLPSRRMFTSLLAIGFTLVVTSFIVLSSHNSQYSMMEVDDDETGRVLSPAAIASAGLESRGGISDNEMAILETAAGLKFSRRESIAEQQARLIEADSERGLDEAKLISDKKLAEEAELDKLNEGYAQQMQAYLTGSSRVGDVVKVIDRHDATYLRQTPKMKAKLRPSTERQILRAAEAQRAHEKAGLVPAEDADSTERDDNDRRRARAGVVWTNDGFQLVRRIAGRRIIAGSAEGGALAARTSKLALTPITYVAPTESASVAAMAPAASRAPRAVAAAAAARDWRIAATADGINSFLQDLVDRYEDGQGAGSLSARDRLRRHIGSLQLCMVTDPQARGLVAERLSQLRATLAEAAAARRRAVGRGEGSMLQDVDNVYVIPDVDDLDNFIQGVINEVDRVEVPNLGEEEEEEEAAEDKANPAQLSAAPAERSVGADRESIQAFLTTLVRSVRGARSKGAARRLKSTVEALEDCVRGKAGSRDLIAERLSLLQAALRPAGGQLGKGQSMLQDVDSVYVIPDVDDLDNYIQGVINEVDRAQIPKLEEEEEEEAAKAGVQSLSVAPLVDKESHMDQAKAPSYGTYLDRDLWTVLPAGFEINHIDESHDTAKMSEDQSGDSDMTYVAGARKLRKDDAEAGPIRNAYGWLGFGAAIPDAEIPVTTADGPDTAASPGVQSVMSESRGARLLDASAWAAPKPRPYAWLAPPAAAAAPAQKPAAAAAPKAAAPAAAAPAAKVGERVESLAAKPHLGDEIFDVGVWNRQNLGDVMMPADSASISPATYGGWFSGPEALSQRPAPPKPALPLPASGVPLPL